MVESPTKRVEEEEKVGKESDCRLRGRKSVGVRGLCLGFCLCAGFPQVILLWLKAGGGLVKELLKTSRAVAECWLMSYSLIAPSSCELLSSPSQRKGWIILQQLPLQHLGSARAGSGSLGAAQQPQLSWAWDAPTVQRHGCIQGICWNFNIVLVPPTAVVLALIQVLDLSNMDNPACSSPLCPC